jgi:hypothetical protein
MQFVLETRNNSVGGVAAVERIAPDVLVVPVSATITSKPSREKRWRRKLSKQCAS